MRTVRVRIRILTQVCIGEGVDELHVPAAALREVDDLTLTRLFDAVPSSTVAFATAEHVGAMLRAAADVLPARIEHATKSIA